MKLFNCITFLIIAEVNIYVSFTLIITIFLPVAAFATSHEEYKLVLQKSVGERREFCRNFMRKRTRIAVALPTLNARFCEFSYNLNYSYSVEILSLVFLDSWLCRRNQRFFKFVKFSKSFRTLDKIQLSFCNVQFGKTFRFV